MGIFDGILIASDWDGTLFDGDTVPEGTREAINYFISEGGRFSITSGRGPEFLNEQKHFVKPNTYCICFGGSLICDIESGEVIRRGALGEDAFELIDRMLTSGIDIQKINVSYYDGLKHYTPEEYYKFGKEEAMTSSCYKITFNCCDGNDGKALKTFCDSFDSKEYTFARSFSSYLEIMKSEYTKGISAKILKDRIGARVLVAMGDYENDIPLFSECDISFAVANAEECLKNIATYVTKATVRESAAAEVIKTLEKMIFNGEL
jgi:HAD superfamily hydrolase (TIGR01484 family)